LAGCVGALLWSRRGAAAKEFVDSPALEGLAASLEGGAA
jgi:hypothetical protein